MNDDKFNYHIEQTDLRLERIEQKLDSVLESRGSFSGQMKVVIALISAVVSSITAFFVGKQH